MAKYDAQASLSLRMIKAKGKLVTFERSAGTIDPVTQQVTGSPTTFSAYMLALPLSAGKARYMLGEGADITKPRLSVSIALSGVSDEPRNGDRFTWSGKEYALQSVEPLDPAGEGAIFASGYAEAA